MIFNIIEIYYFKSRRVLENIIILSLIDGSAIVNIYGSIRMYSLFILRE